MLVGSFISSILFARAQYHGDQRIITFKPTSHLLEDESGLMDWLEAFLSEYGTVIFSEKGEIKVTCSDEIQPESFWNRLVGCFTLFR